MRIAWVYLEFCLIQISFVRAIAGFVAESGCDGYLDWIFFFYTCCVYGFMFVFICLFVLTQVNLLSELSKKNSFVYTGSHDEGIKIG